MRASSCVSKPEIKGTKYGADLNTEESGKMEMGSHEQKELFYRVIANRDLKYLLSENFALEA